MVPPSSDRISRVPPYSSSPTKHSFCLRGYHPLLLAFPNHSTKQCFIFCDWASPRSLAATDGISIDVFSSGYLDVSVPQVRFLSLCIQERMTFRPGFPIQISPDHSLLPAPRCFSQATTSFVAFYCQGILRMRFVT